MRYAIIALALLLAGCGTAPVVNVVAGCEIPSKYDTVKTTPADLPPGTTSKAFAEAATRERGQHKTDVDDFNGFHDYVKTNCTK
jgi:hypothetical protein